MPGLLCARVVVVVGVSDALPLCFEAFGVDGAGAAAGERRERHDGDVGRIGLEIPHLASLGAGAVLVDRLAVVAQAFVDVGAGARCDADAGKEANREHQRVGLWECVPHGITIAPFAGWFR